MQSKPNSQKPLPGECLAVCAACGGRVVVPQAAGEPPFVLHKPNCPREGWPVLEAAAYDDGSQATRDNWPNGDGGASQERARERLGVDLQALPVPDGCTGQRDADGGLVHEPSDSACPIHPIYE